MKIAPLPAGSDWVAEVAEVQFAYWGALTGHPSRDAYEAFLQSAATTFGLPAVFVASEGATLLGSVNLMPSEMTIRSSLTPWMGQLFVPPDHRRSGIGAGLIEAAASHAAALGFEALYLFTSGTLPAYYRSLGWADVEEVDYLGRLRTVMRLSLANAA